MISKAALERGFRCTVICDAKCHKAWGIRNRPHVQLSDNPKDIAWLADDELGDAPANISHHVLHKPQSPHERLNLWCIDHCERRTLVLDVILNSGVDFELRDWTRRNYNLAESDPDGKTPRPTKRPQNSAEFKARGYTAYYKKKGLVGHPEPLWVVNDPNGRRLATGGTEESAWINAINEWTMRYIFGGGEVNESRWLRLDEGDSE